MKDQKLWKKIEAFNLDEKNAKLTFSQRLARENNWSLDFSKKVIQEYKKFIYLCCISNTPITPSDSVDQAWHLHLTYTRSYWKKLCSETIHKEIHHNPTKGGSEEKEKFIDCYDVTFEVYKSEFNDNPPDSIWLNNEKRFGKRNFKRINVDSFWLIKKPTINYSSALKLIIAGVLLPSLFIQAESDSTIFSLVVTGCFVAIILLIKAFRGGGNRGDGSGSSCSGCSDSYDSDCSSCCGD